MDKLTDLFCLTIFFDKKRFILHFVLFCTFLQILRDTSQQDFPIEQGHGARPTKYGGKLFMADGGHIFLGKFIGGLLYMGVNELTIELSNCFSPWIYNIIYFLAWFIVAFKY